MGLVLSRALAAVQETLMGTKARILLIGLDNAGKTTLLTFLAQGEVAPTIPTVGFNVDTVKIGGATLEMWDMGGQDSIRPLWRRYVEGADGVVMMVDANDERRMGEAKAELDKILQEPELAKASVLVLANKQDLPGAATPSQVSESMDLGSMRQPNFVAPCVAINGDGLDKAFDWLCRSMKETRRAG